MWKTGWEGDKGRSRETGDYYNNLKYNGGLSLHKEVVRTGLSLGRFLKEKPSGFTKGLGVCVRERAELRITRSLLSWVILKMELHWLRQGRLEKEQMWGKKIKSSVGGRWSKGITSSCRISIKDVRSSMVTVHNVTDTAVWYPWKLLKEWNLRVLSIKKQHFFLVLLLYLYEMMVLTKFIMEIISQYMQVKSLCCFLDLYSMWINYISIKLGKSWSLDTSWNSYLITKWKCQGQSWLLKV